MSEIHKRIEIGFESFSNLIYEHRLKTLLIMVLFIAVLISGVRKSRFDTSTEAFLYTNDPILLTYNQFREAFGRDEIILLAIKGQEIFEQNFLKRLKAMHQELEEKVPHLDEVTSLINARNTRGEGDRLIVEDLFENWPQNDAEMETIKKRVMANTFYQNLLISEDSRFTAIVIKTSSYSSAGTQGDVMEGFDDDLDFGEDTIEAQAPVYLTDEENSEIVNAVREVIKSYQGPDFQIYLAGSPVVTNDLKRSMIRDARKFLLMAMVVVAFFLFILFRRASGVILPMVVVFLALLSTVGLMGHFNVSLKLPTNVLPSFLLAVGVGGAVHILTIFYRRLAFGDTKKEAMAYSLGHSGLAVVMTTLTTASGLFSFYVAEVAPIAELGIFAGVGVILAMIYTLVIFPAVISLIPLPTKALTRREQEEGSSLDRLLVYIGEIGVKHPFIVIVITVIILAVSFFGAFQSRFSHNVLKWLPADFPIRISTEMIDQHMKGATVLEAVVDTGRENGLYEPEVLNRLEEMKAYAQTYHQDDLFIGKTMALTDILKEIHQALNENNAEFYKVPQDRALIPQEFLLFENSGSDDLEDYVDSQFSKTRFTLKVPWNDAIVYDRFIQNMEKKFRETFAGHADITVTGLICIMGRTLSAAIHTMAKSYLLAFVVITIMMILLIGNFRIGLVSMIPNLSPIVVTLGIIGFTGIPLDMFTMLIGSVVIGLAVDDTIHFMHNFRRYHYETGKVTQAVHMTLQTTGRAMLFTSIVLACGFFILMVSEMNNLTNFGFLTGVSIILALLADFLLAPALMVLVYGRDK